MILADPILNSLRVRRALNDADRQAVLAVRWQGYRKYGCANGLVAEGIDSSPGAVLLLATDENDTPVGTLRILDRRHGPIELDGFLPVDALIPAARQPIAEATRFSVPPSPASHCVKLVLWKAYYRYAAATGICTMLVAVRPSAARDYKRLLFENLGPSGTFAHAQLGGLAHETWAFDVHTGPQRYRNIGHPFYEFFVEREHPAITFT